MKYLLLILLLMMAVPSYSATTIVSWNWPLTYCDNTDIDQNDWIRAELVYHTQSMPMPSDDYGTCGSIIDPSPVAEAITIPITTPSALLAIQVDYNTTYYIRVRVCYKTEFNCSSWSTERILTIGDSIPDNPTFLNIF